MIKIAPGTQLNQRYIVKSLLNENSMSCEYEAEDTLFTVNVLLKVLFMSDAKDWKQIELFQREAIVLKSLNYKSIPKYIDYFTQELNGKTAFVLVHQFVKGQRLNALISDAHPLAPERIKTILLQGLEILHYIHGLYPPVIHRDINPSNIIIDEKDIIYLIGFSTTGAFTKDTLMGSQTFVGEIGFLPEEQILGKVMPECDIYSWGMCIVSLLTGKKPLDIEGKGKEIIDECNIEEPLKKLIGKCVEKDYKLRLSSAIDGIHYLQGKISFENLLKLSEKRVGNVKVTEVSSDKKQIDFLPHSHDLTCKMSALTIWILMMAFFAFIAKTLFHSAGLFIFIVPILFCLFGIIILIKDYRTIYLKTQLWLNGNSLVCQKGVIFHKQTKIPFQNFHGINISCEHQSVNNNNRTVTMVIQNSAGKPFMLGKEVLLSINEAEFIKEVIEEHISQHIII